MNAPGSNAPRESAALRFLYRTIPGRALLRLLTAPGLSRAAGAFLDSPLSRPLIPGFVKRNRIRLEDFEDGPWRCFNDFFSRQIRPGLRPVCPDPDALIAPCDGLLTAYPIRDGLILPVKQSRYTVEDLLNGDPIARRYDGGKCLVFRLCVEHYHRYCYLDDGEKSGNTFLPGVLHTVRPIALREMPVFTRNCREYTVLRTRGFGSVLQMEVGAMLVGKIQNLHGQATFRRGEEKGRFLYGGSTIILLLEAGAAELSGEILAASAEGRETPVRMGEAIGRAPS